MANRMIFGIVFFNVVVVSVLVWVSAAHLAPIYPTAAIVCPMLLVANYLFFRRRGDRQMTTTPPNKSISLKLGKFVAIVFTANVILQIILFIIEPNARTVSQVLIGALLAGLLWTFVYRQSSSP
jgi:membrane associated rhomboid family serine protease